MAKPVFEHRHYKAIAASVHAIICSEVKAGNWLAEAFADQMCGTNPNFDRERFLAACRNEPINRRDKVRQ